jgi:hypothetical protein
MHFKPLVRPTSFGLALANAAIQAASTVRKMDESNWITRRVIQNLERDNLGIVREPSTNLHLKYKTAKELQARGVI